MKSFGKRATSVAATLILIGGFKGIAHADQIRTVSGVVEGSVLDDGIRSYKGIPFAAPPIGELRWKAPKPAATWNDVRPATQFGPRCMQQTIFSNMVFRSNGMSEDCLYLNVWTPAKSPTDRLPVLVYFFGGGYLAGDGSEPRYDGEAMAREGIVTLTVNYRLNVFGFLALSELTKESPNKSSGNYALLDQIAALQWVRDNIAAFGGDPARVTIAGESAGSISVSALMASPLSKGLLAGAIGESGAMINPTLPAVPLAEAEQQGQMFATAVGAPSTAALRAMSAERLLALGGGREPLFTSATVDGWVLPDQLVAIFQNGQQARVPLLIGSNSAERSWRALLGADDPSPETYRATMLRLFGTRVNEALKLYPGSTSEEVTRSATELASDQFVSYSTWKWFDLHSRTSDRSVYYYFYAHPRPPAVKGPTNAAPPAGAVHSAEIEYVMGNLASNKVFRWDDDDQRVSRVMKSYFANFIKTGNPNGAGLVKWPSTRGDDVVQRLRIDTDPRVEVDNRRPGYLFLDSIYMKQHKP